MHHLIRRVADKGLLSSQLITLANDLFELRNQVVHGTGVTISITEAESYSQAAANVIDALTLAESSNYLAISYEEDVLRALRGMIGDRIEVIKDNSGPDFKVTLKNGKSVVIETKFLRRHRFSVARASETLEHVRNSIGNDSAVLIVTNTELAPNIEEFNERHSTESPRAEVIQWANQMDDNDLFRALARSAR
jgi:SepF-like predicted cell division protein (DUF552 family)